MVPVAVTVLEIFPLVTLMVSNSIGLPDERFEIKNQAIAIAITRISGIMIFLFFIDR